MALAVGGWGGAQQGGVRFEVTSVVEALPADGESTATLVAFLADAAGRPFDGEVVRFALQRGVGTLSAPALGQDVVGEVPGGAAGREPLVGDTSVEGRNLGNGVYVARYRAGAVPGRVRIGAVWLSAADGPLPQAFTEIDLVAAQSLSLRVDDDVLLADGKDQATIIAYVLNALDRPAVGERVTFRVIRGAGELEFLGEENGRYAAVYTAGTTPGEAVIEVALPTISRPLRKRVTITAVEAARLEARAFPQRVARRVTQGPVRARNTATLLVAVRDGDGNLLRGLTPRDLVAQVVRGPGSVSQGREVQFTNGEGAGVYYFTFLASAVNGTATIQVTNLASPGAPTIEVRVQTVSQRSAGLAEGLEFEVYTDDPFYADGQSQALVVAMVADRQGGMVEGLDLDFVITEGRGEVVARGVELENLAGGEGTGVYTTTVTAGQAATGARTRVRAAVVNRSGALITGEVTLRSDPLGTPRVVIFPERIPANRAARAVIDIFDFEAESLEGQGARYRVQVLSGPGQVVTEARNDGGGLDLVADDNVHTALYEATARAVDQRVRLRVTDVIPGGYPSVQGTLRLGQATVLKGFVVPREVSRGEAVQVIVLARDEFGLPAVGHEILLTVVDGSGAVVARGRMRDDGGRVGGYADAYANDGMYVGAFRASAIASREITLRITDTTPSPQPTLNLRVRVR
ncbi:Ig-like domain-containing protein [Marinithermus hydrothermalis]|nr:Ig-like domain-containing protein [Marinithermus hydrothermalis]